MDKNKSVFIKLLSQKSMKQGFCKKNDTWY